MKTSSIIRSLPCFLFSFDFARGRRWESRASRDPAKRGEGRFFDGVLVLVLSALLLLSPMAAIAADNAWTGSGPFATGLGNRVISAIAIDPTNADVIYAGTGSGTVFQYMQVRPSVTTNAASSITTDSATLNATVNAHDAETLVTFEYGLTSGHGSTIAGIPATATGVSDTSVIASIGSLTPGLTYHYRAVGASLAGTVNGMDSTFTMLKADQAPLALIAGSPLTYNTTEPLSTTGGSGSGAVSYQVTSGSCSISGSNQLRANSGIGTCTVQATKAGNINYNARTTAPVIVTLQKAEQSTLTLNAGSTLTYNATQTLSTIGGSGTGGVSYEVTSGSCALSGAGGNLLTANSGSGTCSITATLPSNDNYDETTASAIVTLQKAGTQTTLGASVAFSIPVPTVTLTATISSPAGTPSSGTVAFSEGGSDIPGCGSISVVSGSAVCTTNSLTPSVYDITAVYSGNGDYLGSTAETRRISTLLGKMARNSWYLSPEGWIVRAYTNSEAPNEVYIEVMDTSGNIVNALDVSGMGSNPMLIAADAVAPDVSLGFDKRTQTAYVMYTCAEGGRVVAVPGVLSSVR
jgi:hypothetical protein